MGPGILYHTIPHNPFLQPTCNYKFAHKNREPSFPSDKSRAFWLNPVMDVPSLIATLFQFIDFGLSLKSVPAQSLQFLTLLDRVRADLDEALRERCGKQSALELCPGKKAWIDGAILDIRRALCDLGAQVEGPRVDIQCGRTVTLKHRFGWVLRNHGKFLTMESMLSTCHASLLVAINALHTLQATTGATATSPMPEADLLGGEANTLHSMPTLKSPAARRPKRSTNKISESALSILPVEIDSTPKKTTSLPQEPLESSRWDTIFETSPAWQSVSSLALTTFEPTSPISSSSTLIPRHDSMFDAPQLPAIQCADQDLLSPDIDTTFPGHDPLDTENEKFNGSVKADLLRRSTVQERRRRARAQFGRC